MQTKSKSVLKKFFGGNKKMKKDSKNVFGAIFSILIMITSVAPLQFGAFTLASIVTLATVAPAVEAANGIGEVTFFDIDDSGLPGTEITKGVQTVDTQKEHVYRIHNNDDGPIDCIDEIMITYPNTWQDVISMAEVSVTNMGAVILSNDADTGSLTDLVVNNKSIRIVPDKSKDGVELCPSGTTEITIGGNIKSPVNPEDSTIKIYTSDMSHNEPSTGQVRQLIASLPVIHVTAAEQLKVQYLDFTSTGADSGADLRITASARGAWGRLTELYLKGTVATTIDVYMDDGSGVLDAGDRKIASAHVVGTSTTSVGLNNYAGFDVGSNVNEGFVKDVEQGGSPVEYYIDITGAASVLTIEGHADEDGNQAIDLTYDGTGYTNPPKEGTVLNVEVPGRQRLILVQLVREDPTNSSRLLDVLDDNIPIYFTTTLSSFSAGYVSPRLTDSSGQTELSLEPGTTAGNALVEVCFPDPECTDEDVAISPGVADSCAITKGLNTEVEAGSIEIIEATVYDQYGNPISNNPSPPTVAFDIVSSPGPDADLDDDINPPFTGDGDQFESEPSNFGIADVSLQTSATVGDHVVQVDANGIPCGTTTVKGVLGQGGKTSCEVIGVDDPLTPLEETEIDADDCFDVLVTVKDKNGNPLPKWESIVEFSLEDTSKTIQSTTFREEKFITPYKVQGKLNPNDPAQALVTVCGCDELGTLDVFCKTDTLDDGTDRLNVINSQPTCVDVGLEERDDVCDDTMKLHTSILDTCGNKVVDQECGNVQGGGSATSCILLEASCGELSTEKTCVDLFNTGQAPLVDLDISQCGCGNIEINATDTGDCCDSVYEGQLPQCNGPLVINKVGPTDRIELEVYPKASNQDNFWVSEKAVAELTLKDACNQDVVCEQAYVNVELTGEDCVDDTIQVDSPIEFPEEETHGCNIYDEPVHKVVIENCAVGAKEEFCAQSGDFGTEHECPRHQTKDECNLDEFCTWTGNKEWTDLPEKDDIVVDKIAFEYNGPTTDVTVCVYEETEVQAGFQASGSNADLLWKCSELDNVPTIPSGDSDTSENAAWDEIHDANNLQDGIGDIYLIELDDRISKFNGNNEYDNQRLGGAIVEPGDTKDFYLVIKNNDGTCGTYDADYLYFQDYNSPDIVDWSRNPTDLDNPPVVDGMNSSGEWDRAMQVPIANNKGTAYVMASTKYLYVLYDIDDPTDQRKGENLCGNDKIGFNINPAGNANWGKPYDLVFQTGTDPAAFTTPDPDVPGSSGLTDGYETEWVIDGTQLPLPADVETKTIYSGGRRLTEWKVPIKSIGLQGGDSFLFGGAVDIECSSNAFPSTLNWNNPASTFLTFANVIGTHVRDTLEDSEEYTRRNDDYTGTDPYPVTTASTSSYGFGDRILHNLGLFNGKAWVYFRDLVAETVNIFVDAGLPVVFIGHLPAVSNDQAEVTFLAQPATQVVARNHGDLSGDSFICDDAGFEPTYEFDPDQKDGPCTDGGNNNCGDHDLVRDCRPAMACDGEGYDINLQVTDGFQNQVGLETEVQLDSCLTFPHFIYLGDTLLPAEENITIDLWDFLGLHDIVDKNGKIIGSDPRDVCFDMVVFKQAILDIFDSLEMDDEFIKSFVGSEEFDDFVSSIFEDKKVTFVAASGYPIGVDAAGHLAVNTTADGKAKVRIESEESSMFQIKSFDASYRLFFTPHALDADYFDVAFAPGEPARWDVIAVPMEGIPADGEQEAKILIRKTDFCGNPVAVDEEVKVSALSNSGRAVISRDFSHANNYDNQVVGDMSQWSCKFLFPWFDDCHLTVLNDVIEDVTVVVEDAFCEQTGEGVCANLIEGPPCSTIHNEQACNAETELCIWQPGEICQEADASVISFVGAPTQLKITEILHSDLIPADGWKLWEADHRFDLPKDACTDGQIRECVLGGEPEICFKDCVQYGNTGAWVTVEVQDKFNQRVTGYLGDGFKRDPGDVAGSPDNVFEKICVALDDKRAFIRDSTFGWIDLDLWGVSNGAKVYCGDLAYGKGSFNVVYRMLDWDGQPLDPRETRKVIVSVFDVCDRDLFEDYSASWKTEKWDDLCNGQEYNENNLPDSETASRLDPDSNKIIYTAVPDRWDINTDKLVVAADGQDSATLTINPETEYMDIRTSLDATVQSSLLGSKLESEAITPGCYVEGIFDPINPTSINVQTEACSAGFAELQLSSIKPGNARVTVTGNGFGCKEWITGKEYKDWFELTFGEAVTIGFDLVGWHQTCVEESTLDCDLHFPGEGPEIDCVDAATTTCNGLAASFHIYFTEYEEITSGFSEQENTVLYTPFCKEFGVIPLTPADMNIEFKQSFQNKIVLEEGWNFFSVPVELDPSNDQWGELGLNTICDSSASWNDATQSWVAPVPVGTPVVPLEGYWCRVSSDTVKDVVPIDASGGVFLPPTKQIFSGWNDVGLSSYVETVMEHALISIDSIYATVLDWLETLQRYASFANTGELGGGNVPGTTGTNSMLAGQGYFVYAKDSGTLAGLS